MKTAKPTATAAAKAVTAGSDHSHEPGHTHGDSQEAALTLAEEYCRERGEKLTPIRRKV
ncbi:MAG TPA: transcriptional repressor, partial [Paraburkholderia sp.]|nr:transcriptional repressor [Paraburkholderia sp.]